MTIAAARSVALWYSFTRVVEAESYKHHRGFGCGDKMIQTMHEEYESMSLITLTEYSDCVTLSREEGSVQARQSAAFVLLPYGIRRTAMLGELNGRVVG